MDTDAKTDLTTPTTSDQYVHADIFEWSNNLVQYADELSVELYFFNKNSTVYRVKLDGEPAKQLRPLFVDELLEGMLDGMENGLRVRSFEEAEAEDGVLQYTRVDNVERLQSVLHWIKHQQHNIEVFDDAEHDLKRMKGVVAACSHKELAQPFFVIKNLPTTQIMKGKTAWLLKDGVFKPFDGMSALKIPSESQLLVLDQDVFVFKQTRLKQLFGYDAKAASIAAQKVAEIEANFHLSFADGVDLQSLIKGKPATIKKLQRIEPATIKQQDLIDHAEELDLELMTDDSGAIIIVDQKDLVRFVNLLNDDYVESNMTGQRYEILAKRPLKVADETKANPDS